MYGFELILKKWSRGVVPCVCSSM